MMLSPSVIYIYIYIYIYMGVPICTPNPVKTAPQSKIISEQYTQTIMQFTVIFESEL